MTPPRVSQDTLEMRKLVAMVPKDLFDRLEVLAERHDRTVSAEVRQAIRAYLDKHNGKVA